MYTYVTVHTVIFLQVHFSSNDQVVGLTLFVKFTGNVSHYFQLVLETGAFFLVPQQSRFLETLSSLSIQVMARWELSLDIRCGIRALSGTVVVRMRSSDVSQKFPQLVLKGQAVGQVWTVLPLSEPGAQKSSTVVLTKIAAFLLCATPHKNQYRVKFCFYYFCHRGANFSDKNQIE